MYFFSMCYTLVEVSVIVHLHLKFYCKMTCELSFMEQSFIPTSKAQELMMPDER